MNRERINQLEHFLKEDPNDTFSRYALALEYRQTDAACAEAHFNELLQHHPEYLPTYYHAASFFAELGRTEIAAAIYQKGIELARRQQNQHALRELSTAWQNFQFENE